MTKVKNYSITKESTDEMIAAGRFNPSLEIIFRDRHGIHRHKLSAGYGDDIHVYREAGQTDVAQTIINRQNEGLTDLTVNVDVICIAGGKFVPMNAVPVSKNDFQGRIEPAGGDHFIC